MRTILSQAWLNDRFVPAGQEIPDEGSATYDVLRVMDGAPLFLERHLQRVDNALAARGFPLQKDRIRQLLPELIAANGGKTVNMNVKILAGGSLDLAMGFVESSYPSPEDYLQGVRLVTARIERTDPGLKVWNDRYKQEIADILARTEAYEVLLVNREGLLTEGSKSNFFAVAGNTVYTPRAEMLPGVTRYYVQEAIRQAGYPLEETDLPADGLKDMDSVFLTGTSPGVLPGREVDAHPFDPSSPVLRDIMEAYDRLVEEDLAQWKSSQ